MAQGYMVICDSSGCGKAAQVGGTVDPLGLREPQLPKGWLAVLEGNGTPVPPKWEFCSLACLNTCLSRQDKIRAGEAAYEGEDRPWRR